MEISSLGCTRKGVVIRSLDIWECGEVKWQFRAKYFKTEETRCTFQFCHEVAQWLWEQFICNHCHFSETKSLQHRFYNRKLQSVNIISYSFVNQSRLSLQVLSSSHLAIWRELTKALSQCFYHDPWCVVSNFFLLPTFCSLKSKHLPHKCWWNIYLSGHLQISVEFEEKELLSQPFWL